MSHEHEPAATSECTIQTRENVSMYSTPLLSITYRRLRLERRLCKYQPKILQLDFTVRKSLEMSCNICENVQTSELNSTGKENKVLTCVKCKIKVHRLCYGASVKSARNWVCSYCTASNSLVGKNKIIKKCQLCPSKIGAFKPTKCGKWVHIICALFSPHCSFENVETMEPIHISPIRLKQPCDNCDEHVRGSVKCFVKGCKKYLHVTCAQACHSLREELNGDEEGSSINFRLYCKIHIKSQPKVRLSLEHIKEHVLSRRSIEVGGEFGEAGCNNGHRGGKNDDKLEEALAGHKNDDTNADENNDPGKVVRLG